MITLYNFDIKKVIKAQEKFPVFSHDIADLVYPTQWKRYTPLFAEFFSFHLFPQRRFWLCLPEEQKKFLAKMREFMKAINEYNYKVSEEYRLFPEFFILPIPENWKPNDKFARYCIKMFCDKIFESAVNEIELELMEFEAELRKQLDEILTMIDSSLPHPLAVLKSRLRDGDGVLQKTLEFAKEWESWKRQESFISSFSKSLAYYSELVIKIVRNEVKKLRSKIRPACKAIVFVARVLGSKELEQKVREFFKVPTFEKFKEVKKTYEKAIREYLS